MLAGCIREQDRSILGRYLRIRNVFKATTDCMDKFCVVCGQALLRLNGGVLLFGFVDACVVGVEIDQPSTNDRRHRCSNHPAAVKRSVATL